MEKGSEKKKDPGKTEKEYVKSKDVNLCLEKPMLSFGYSRPLSIANFNICVQSSCIKSAYLYCFIWYCVTR